MESPRGSPIPTHPTPPHPRRSRSRSRKRNGSRQHVRRRTDGRKGVGAGERGNNERISEAQGQQARVMASMLSFHISDHVLVRIKGRDSSRRGSTPRWRKQIGRAFGDDAFPSFRNCT